MKAAKTFIDVKTGELTSTRDDLEEAATELMEKTLDELHENEKAEAEAKAKEAEEVKKHGRRYAEYTLYGIIPADEEDELERTSRRIAERQQAKAEEEAAEEKTEEAPKAEEEKPAKTEKVFRINAREMNYFFAKGYKDIWWSEEMKKEIRAGGYSQVIYNKYDNFVRNGGCILITIELATRKDGMKRYAQFRLVYHDGFFCLSHAYTHADIALKRALDRYNIKFTNRTKAPAREWKPIIIDPELFHLDKKTPAPVQETAETVHTEEIDGYAAPVLDLTESDFHAMFSPKAAEPETTEETPAEPEEVKEEEPEALEETAEPEKKEAQKEETPKSKTAQEIERFRKEKAYRAEFTTEFYRYWKENAYLVELSHGQTDENAPQPYGKPWTWGSRCYSYKLGCNAQESARRWMNNNFTQIIKSLESGMLQLS